MKQKRTLILVAVFVLVLAGAYLLYNNLSKDTQTDQLVVLGDQKQEQTQQTESQKQTESTQSQEQVESTQSQQQTEAVESTETPVNLAPNFTVYDAAGKAVRLHDFIGKPIVLNFWASWCGPCKNEMPEFQKLYEELGQQVTFLMVNAGQETATNVKSFLENAGYTFPVYYDTTDGAAIAYRVSSLPTTYFLNAKGEAVTYAVGMLDEATLRKGISYINP